VIEPVARGKYLLSRQYYMFIKKKGVYTRKKGLDREQNKARSYSSISTTMPLLGARFRSFWKCFRVTARTQCSRFSDSEKGGPNSCGWANKARAMVSRGPRREAEGGSGKRSALPRFTQSLLGS